MLNYPAKFLPFYLVVALIFLFIPGFCAQIELTEIQKQAIMYRQQGWHLQEEGKIDEALTYYQKATLLDPNYVMAYNDTGIILEAMGYPEQAEQMYLKAIKVDPNYPDSYSNLALLYEEEKDYSNAILYWIKRATFGGSGDAWAEAARKRLEDIARVYPEAFSGIGGQSKENPQQLNVAQPSLNLKQPRESLEVIPEALPQLEVSKLPTQEVAQPSLSPLESRLPRESSEVIPEALPQLDVSKLPTSEIELPRTEKTPSEVSLFREQVIPESQMVDNKTRALQHLTLAKQNFARGQYVAALKEATVAEYFDSSNAEISTFVNTIRQKLLK
jgi:tetratricopeptide (TPR) repeat protein